MKKRRRQHCTQVGGMNKADCAGMMPKGKGETEALKCCLGTSASMGITLRSPGLYVLPSQRYLSCSTHILLLSPLRVFLLLPWSSVAIGVRTKGFPTPSEVCSNSSSIAWGEWAWENLCMHTVPLWSLCEFLLTCLLETPAHPLWHQESEAKTDCSLFTSVWSRLPQGPDPPLGPQKWTWSLPVFTQPHDRIPWATSLRYRWSWTLPKTNWQKVWE